MKTDEGTWFLLTSGCLSRFYQGQIKEKNKLGSSGGKTPLPLYEQKKMHTKMPSQIDLLSLHLDLLDMDFTSRRGGGGWF